MTSQEEINRPWADIAFAVATWAERFGSLLTFLLILVGPYGLLTAKAPAGMAAFTYPPFITVFVIGLVGAIARRVLHKHWAHKGPPPTST